MTRSRPARRVLAVLAAQALSLAATAALACDAPSASRPAAGGTPVRVPLGPGDVGVLPEGCEATEASLETRAAVLVATSDLYGSLQAGVGLRGRAVVAERTWISLWAPSLEYRFVANATVEADRASLGGGVVGAHHRIGLGERASVAPFARLLLPTETGFARAARWGGEHGVVATARVRERLEVVGGFAFSLVSVVNGGRTLSVLGETLSADVVYRPWRAFGIAGGTALRLALADARPLESFDPRLALRFYPVRGLFVVLGGAVPLGGRDRTNLGLALSIGWQG
ncbi:MAG: hypothetical protein KF850_19695 [Labilithrix sp.]|nr:hypothetical protein [Labilithrix sp.]MBX3214268.1 hypothetical protein [Labilithrix sp.]